MFIPKVDCHTHTTLSDGRKTAEEVIQLAIRKGLDWIAITDHNILNKELPELRKKYGDRIRLIDGCEVSTEYRTASGERIEVHVIGLDFDPKKLAPMIKDNQFDTKEYVGAIRRALKKCNVIIPTYEDLRKLYPTPAHLGTLQIARYMVLAGYSRDVDDALDTYIGSLGQRKAYVPILDFANYISMKDAIREIIRSGGIPILAHPFTYRISEYERLRLAADFREAAGESPAGMEVFYRRYSFEKQKELKEIADQNALYYSAASDYHGREKDDLMDVLDLSEEETMRMIWTIRRWQ